MKKIIIGILLLFVLFPSSGYSADAKASTDATVVPAAADLIMGLQGGVNKNFAWGANLVSLKGLTFADASIIQLTGAGAAAVLTSGGNNYILGSNADNSALEFKTPANVFALDTVITPLRTIGSANTLVGVNSTGDALEFKSTINIQMDDSAAQFKSATASKGTLKNLLSGSTDGKLLTVAYNHTDNKTLNFPDPTTGDSVTYGSAAIRINTGGATARVKTVSDAAATIVEYGQAGTGNIDTTGTISGGSLTPVIDDPDNFAANFAGANLYGGTFIANAAGTAVLPNPSAGMNFTYVLEGANATIIDPLGTGTADAIIMNGLAAADDENITSSTSGAMCVFQYRSADHWMATCNGFVEATPPG